MPVPNTTTFMLQDVVNTVNPTTDDLVDCFADAVSSKFDSSYSGSKNNLLNFRNYDAGASGNQLSFITTSSGGTYGFYLSNATANSTVNATFKYLSKTTGDLPITVRHAGVARSPGYSYTANVAMGSGGSYFGRGDWAVTSSNFGLGSTVTFQMLINSSTADTLPPSGENPRSHVFVYNDL